jgi:hypothetical protein
MLANDTPAGSDGIVIRGMLPAATVNWLDTPAANVSPNASTHEYRMKYVPAGRLPPDAPPPVAVAVAVVVGFAFAAFVLIIRSIRPRSPPALYWAQFVPLAVMTGATAESWGMA